VRVSRIARIGKLRQHYHFARDFFFRSLDPLRDVFDDMAVVIPGPERHRSVVAARILT